MNLFQANSSLDIALASILPQVFAVACIYHICIHQEAVTNLIISLGAAHQSFGECHVREHRSSMGHCQVQHPSGSRRMNCCWVMAEIQFFDYIYLAFDQVLNFISICQIEYTVMNWHWCQICNEAAKYHYRSWEHLQLVLNLDDIRVHNSISYHGFL